MSKELEALNYLVNLAVVGNKENNRGKIFESEEIVLQALKRNEPMKVNIIATHDEIGLQIGSCSNCGSQTISHYRKGKTISLVDGLFCSTCGQKLDWEEK